ncbi:hypothetical protein V865_006765 [Kwoniella europaea PYCC6329]|uniref:DEAD box family helicase n=1 Tax=Kwoniella europaea PYCC6329 TaxID=1423913 RepID=A0AAX4KQP6_9TREE
MLGAFLVQRMFPRSQIPFNLDAFFFISELSQQRQKFLSAQVALENTSSSQPVCTDIVEHEDSAAQTEVARNLYKHQEEAIQACLGAFRDGLTRVAVQLPTGSGKTFEFANLIPLVHQQQDRIEVWCRRRTVILVDGIELLDQAEKEIKQVLGKDWSVDVEQGFRMSSGTSDITIATIQSLSKSNRLSKYDPSEFRLIVVDESHHSASVSWLKLLHYFNREIDLPARIEPYTLEHPSAKVPIVGFSATLARHDGLSLLPVYQKLVYHQDISYMLENGILSPYVEMTVKQQEERSHDIDKHDDFSPTALAREVNTHEVNQLVVRTWLEKCPMRRSTLAFCVNRQHIEDLVQAFKDEGVDAREISGYTKLEERKKLVEDFRKGVFPVLVNCRLMTEGTNIPEIDCILVVCPTQSRPLLVQMVGRGLRLSPHTNKVNCLILYLADVNRGTTANSMYVLPTLGGIILQDRSTKIPIHTLSLSNPEAPYKKNTDYDADSFDVSYLTEDVNKRGLFNIERSSAKVPYVTKNAWIECSDREYVLSVFKHGKIIIERLIRSKVQYRVYCKPASASHEVDGDWDVVGHVDTLEDAFKLGDKIALDVFGEEIYPQSSKSAKWRSNRASIPAIKRYLFSKFIRTRDKSEEDIRKIIVDTGDGQKIGVGRLTSGDIADLIEISNFPTIRKVSY